MKTHKDDFEDEKEARRRYPYLYDTEIAEESESLEIEDGRTLNDPEKAVNYHYLASLEDAHLPHLDYYRYDNLFAAKGGNAWLRDAVKAPVPRSLFGEFWHEGELSILFADTGKGKSLLAVQIGQSIASGLPFKPFELSAKAQRVLYFDFELSEQQFASRYCAVDSDGQLIPDSLPFADNFIRSAPRFGLEDELPGEFKTYSDYVVGSLVEFINFSGARVVIIDNITWLNTSTHNSTAALRLMKQLKRFQKMFGVSFLLIAHSPKLICTASILLNDLQGSKMLSNFADNVFALGADFYQKDIRYLKQLKVRNRAPVHDGSNVCTLRLKKLPSFQRRGGREADGVVDPVRTASGSDRVLKTPRLSKEGWLRFADGVVPTSPDNRPPTTERNFLGFEFLGYCKERNHLRFMGCNSNSERAKLLRKAAGLETEVRIKRSQMIQKVAELTAAGRTQRQIAAELGLSSTTVHAYRKINKGK